MKTYFKIHFLIRIAKKEEGKKRAVSCV